MQPSFLLSVLLSIAIALHFMACGSSPKSSGGGVVEDSESPVVGAAISFSDITFREINISVGAATDDRTDQVELEYKIVHAATESDINTIAKANASTEGSIVQNWTANVVDFTHDSLDPATNYCYAVLVRDRARNMSIYTTDCQATAGDSTSPVRGTGIVFTAVEGDEMTISVGAATDTVTPAEDLTYKFVYVPGASTTPINTIAKVDAFTGPNLLQDWTANALSINHEGLSPNTSYCYAVLVKDSANNMSLYNPVCRLTLNIRRIFVTATSYNGNLGGAAGADAKCASDANKPATGNYFALIADNTRIPSTLTDWVLSPSTAYTRANGVTPIGTTNGAAIFTFPLSSSIGTAPASVWVGINDTDWSNFDNCDNWSDAMAIAGRYGAADSTTATAIHADTSACTEMRRLYCVEVITF